MGLEAQRFAPLAWDYLRYSLVTDLSRMRDELAFSPTYTAAESLRQFAGEDQGNGSGMIGEGWLRDIIARRQRERERRASD